ncbi:MAG: hypothetical protein JXP34_04845 [Planctomycetes bacterium]|nr:hypothetical protein [Planctomycetota bacterium]
MSSIEFDCPSCGGPLPNPGAVRCPSCGEPLKGGDVHLGTSFDRRARRIDVLASLRTLRDIYLHPFRTFRSMRPEGPAGDALVYVLLIGIPPLVLYAVGLVLGGRVTAGRAAIAVACSPVILAAGIGAWAGVIHIVLTLTGRGRRGFSATFRAMAFSLASSSILWLIPYGGPFVAVAMYLWLQLIAVKELHRIRLGDAAMAVLVPGFILAGLGLFLGFFSLAYILGEKVAERGGTP